MAGQRAHRNTFVATLLACTVVVACCMSAVAGANLENVWVSDTGTNSVTCGASTSPCATIAYAKQERAVATNAVVRVTPSHPTPPCAVISQPPPFRPVPMHRSTLALASLHYQPSQMFRT